MLHSLVKSLQSHLNILYADDGALGGPGRLVLADLISIQTASADLGLHLNAAKCELWAFGDHESVDAISDLLDNAEYLSLFVLVTRGAIPPFQPFSHNSLSRKKKTQLHFIR
jgi:hypothetical protein